MGELAGRVLAVAPLARLWLARMLAAPVQVAVEVTSRCNADCVTCPRRGMRRPQRDLPLARFREIVGQCRRAGVRNLVLNGYGEIFVSPAAPDYLAAARAGHPSATIVVNTNGHLMDERAAQALLAARVDAVLVTVDGTDAASFGASRRHLDYDRVCANVRRLLAMRDRAEGGRRTRVSVMMLPRPENGHLMPVFRAQWTGVADEVVFGGFSTLAGAIPGDETDGGRRATRDRLPCMRLFRELSLYVDGSASLCCIDWDCRVPVGHLDRDSLVGIWRGRRLRAIRRQHLRGRKLAATPLCRHCHPELWDGQPAWWCNLFREFAVPTR